MFLTFVVNALNELADLTRQVYEAVEVARRKGVEARCKGALKHLRFRRKKILTKYPHARAYLTSTN